MLFGPPKSYKSFMAIDWSCCIAADNSWCGNPIKNSGLVIYIAGEGFNGIGRRIYAWCQENDLDPDELKLVVSSRPAKISDEDYVDIILEEVNAACEKHDALPALFVIDTLARNFGAGDENNTSDMNTIVMHLDDIRRPYGASMLVVHHTGRANTSRERGSSSLPGALDASFMLTVDAQVKTVTLEPQFMKDAAIPDPMDFNIKLVTLDGMTDDEGGSVSSVVLEHLGGISQAKKRQLFKDHPELGTGQRRNWLGKLLYAASECGGGCSNNHLAEAANVSGSTVGPVIKLLRDAGILTADNGLTAEGQAALDILEPTHRLKRLMGQNSDG